ncbi:hypothetical protein FOZ62_000681 [Perkinsus olseni]|uniref:IQ motif and ubiquitin-like domain-containing protein n=2 Tax=Perkinsus olseni TaxID=32597 RepID=A0A7J6TXP6_PEROL|nr:hypothetical protein FOZ62_000681 [Perkinsus olseni]
MLSQQTEGAEEAGDTFKAEHQPSEPTPHEEEDGQDAVASSTGERCKPFLGGYLNETTGVEYHHATSQTEPTQPSPLQRSTRYHRDAQTCVARTRHIQTTREQGTSMPRHYLAELTKDGDRTLSPRPYFSSADRDALVAEKAIIIQSHTRGMLARIRCRHLRAERDKLERQRQCEEEEARMEDELMRRREVERRLHPRTYDDFITLYSEVEAWRLNETKRIKECEDMGEEEKHTALRELLSKEVKLLQTVDRLKIHARKYNRNTKINKKLEAMARPKVWTQSDGDSTIVHTPSTTRAKEFMDLYRALRLTTLTTNERLDLLLHVKWAVMEFPCKLTSDIAELLDREADLINRGRGSGSMKGLRERIANLFFDFINTPEFNPEAQPFHRMPKMDANG